MADSKYSVDYKSKYYELRSNFLSATKRAYSAGYEHGARDVRMENMAQQAQQAQAMAMQGGMVPGQDQVPPEMSADQQVDQLQDQQMQSHQSELEAKIQELDQALAGEEVDKNEIASLVSQINKSMEAIKLIKSTKEIRSLLKTERMKELHKDIKVEVKKVVSNLDNTRQQALSMQKSIVDSIVKKMESEEKSAMTKILNTVRKEGHGHD